jgi:hypothetical protein
MMSEQWHVGERVDKEVAFVDGKVILFEFWFKQDLAQMKKELG